MNQLAYTLEELEHVLCSKQQAAHELSLTASQLDWLLQQFGCSPVRVGGQLCVTRLDVDRMAGSLLHRQALGLETETDRRKRMNKKMMGC